MLTLLWTRWCVIWIIRFYRWKEKDNKLFHYVVVTNMVVDAVIAYLLDMLEDWWAIPHLVIKSTTLTIWIFKRNMFLFKNKIRIIGIRLPNMYLMKWRGSLFGWMISSISSIYGNRMRGVLCGFFLALSIFLPWGKRSRFSFFHYYFFSSYQFYFFPNQLACQHTTYLFFLGLIV